MINDFTIGRSDFSVTVYVPWNCTNNCKFCSSKKDYERIKGDYEKVRQSLRLIRDSMLPIVVFTGGEPSADVDKLRELLKIVDNKVVYINTSLPKRNSKEFIELVNSTECIKSISISRHTHSYEEDSEILHQIAEDEVIATIQKPVRINIVEQNEGSFSIESIEKYVSRWTRIAKMKGGPYSLLLNLRSNYVTQSKSDLHEMTDSKVINDLATAYYYQSHTFCNVCDTCTFIKFNEKHDDELVINYHRGVMTTAVQFANVVEINDLIILQNGDICYDWDGKNENISKFLSMINTQKQ